MRIHAFEHAPFEGVGCIGDWARDRGHYLRSTLLYNSEQLPNPDEFDWLIIMGGPMGIYDEHQFPWLKEEKVFIKKAVDANKTVIGICLGSQLIANILGAKVYKNPQVEIGWFDVIREKESYQTDLLAGFDYKMKVFLWHGDTFELPDGAIPLFRSEACKNQGYLYKNNVLGLQFHFEMTEMGIAEILAAEDEKLPSGKYVQTMEKILSRRDHIAANNDKMYLLLDRLSDSSKPKKLKQERIKKESTLFQHTK